MERSSIAQVFIGTRIGIYDPAKDLWTGGLLPEAARKSNRH